MSACFLGWAGSLLARFNSFNIYMLSLFTCFISFNISDAYLILSILHAIVGWTGETLCLAGDSAGGNLMISTAMRAASFGIQIPDGIMAAYPVVLVRYTPSPARILALMDPLLPVGIMMRCLAGRFWSLLCTWTEDQITHIDKDKTCTLIRNTFMYMCMSEIFIFF